MPHFRIAYMKGGVAEDYKELGQSSSQWSHVICLIVYTDILCWLARATEQPLPQESENGSASDLASELTVFCLQAGKERWKRPLLFLAASASAS